MTIGDSTRIAGDADKTRLSPREVSATEDRTRLTPREVSTTEDRTRLTPQRHTLIPTPATNQEKSEADEIFAKGEKIGNRYEVVAIHHGAMGVVYGCLDHDTNQLCALKTVRNRHASNKEAVALFDSEAAVWVSLEKHPYIVRAYRVERFKYLRFVVTEYIRGPEGMEGDLRGWLGHPRLTLKVAVTMALQIAQGMQHAVHKVPNLVHRDLKPGNILVNGDGKAMVTDFGLVNAEDAGAGTPAYMSPEQWCQKALDVRSDIYAYGCILFEMFTAHRLFPAESEQAWMTAHLDTVPPSLTNLAPNLPIEIDQFVRKCLEKNAGARPSDWNEVVSFFSQWYHRLTGNAVVLDFSSLELDQDELLTMASSFDVLKRYHDAINFCDKALEININNPAAWAYKASALLKLNRYEEAIESCDKAIAIKSNYSFSWIIKGMALYNLKRYEETTKTNEQALVLEPNGFGALLTKGNVFYKQKRFDEALMAYDAVINVYPDSFEAMRIKGLLLRDLNRFKESIAVFDKMLEIAPYEADTWLNKGNAFYMLKQYKDALHSYDQAIFIDPGYKDALNNRNIVLNVLKSERSLPQKQVASEIKEKSAASSPFWKRLFGK